MSDVRINDLEQQLGAAQKRAGDQDIVLEEAQQELIEQCRLTRAETTRAADFERRMVDATIRAEVAEDELKNLQDALQRWINDDRGEVQDLAGILLRSRGGPSPEELAAFRTQVEEDIDMEAFARQVREMVASANTPGYRLARWRDLAIRSRAKLEALGAVIDEARVELLNAWDKLHEDDPHAGLKHVERAMDVVGVSKQEVDAFLAAKRAADGPRDEAFSWPPEHPVKEPK